MTKSGYGNDSRQTGPFALTSDSTEPCEILTPLSAKGQAEPILFSPTPLPTGMGFAIRRQTRSQFAFTETRPETGTPQKTRKNRPRERYQGVCGSPVRESLRPRFYGGYPPLNRRPPPAVVPSPSPS